MTVPDTNYGTYKISFETSEDLSDVNSSFSSSQPVIRVVAQGQDDKGIRIRSGSFNFTASGFSDNTRTDTLILLSLEAELGARAGIGVFYEDSQNTIKIAGAINGSDEPNGQNIAEIDFENTKGTNIAIDLLGNAELANDWRLLLDIQADSEGVLNAQDDLNISLKSTAGGDFDGFGASKGVAEGGELKWSSAEVNLGTKDEDHRTLYGIIIKDPESGLDSDEVVLEIPGDQVKANVVVKGTASTVSSTVGGSIVDKAPSMVKSSEVTVPENDNLLLVGGPVVNSLTARFIGSTWTYKPGEAVIELKDNGANVALVVAGTDAVDTMRAGRVLRNYEQYKSQLVGTSVKVTGTSASFTDTVVAPR